MKRAGLYLYKTIPFLVMAFILVSLLAQTPTFAAQSAQAVSRPVKIENLADESGFFVLTFQEKIHPSLPEFSFDIYALPIRRGDDYQARRIIISETGTKNIVQEIALSKLNKIVDFPSASDRETMGFVIEDMDFDGYKDIRIIAFMPGGPRIPYFYWLWNQQEGNFSRNQDLEKITAPYFDHANKAIHSKAHISENQSYDIVYKYVNSVPITKEDYLQNLSYLKRMESDLEIQKESEKKKSLKALYKGWNEELDNILGYLLKELEPQMQEDLNAKQKIWLNERENSAKKAQQLSSDSSAYTYDLAMSTKNRTFELIDIFFNKNEK